MPWDSFEKESCFCCCYYSGLLFYFTYSLYIPLTVPLLVNPSHSTSPIPRSSPSPLNGWESPEYLFTLAFQVSATRLGASFPAETRHGSPAKTFLTCRQHLLQLFRTSMMIKLHICYMCTWRPRSSPWMFFGWWQTCFLPRPSSYFCTFQTLWSQAGSVVTWL